MPWPSALPENWTGNFLQQGGGGLNGTVGEPIGNQAVGDKPALARGFAVASSDTGHQSSGGGFDGAFMQDQQAVLDFEFVARASVILFSCHCWSLMPWHLSISNVVRATRRLQISWSW